MRSDFVSRVAHVKHFKDRLQMGLRRLLQACQVLEKVALKHSSKSTKYGLEGSYSGLVHELSWTYHTPFFLGLFFVCTASVSIVVRFQVNDTGHGIEPIYFLIRHARPQHLQP